MANSSLMGENVFFINSLHYTKPSIIMCSRIKLEIMSNSLKVSKIRNVIDVEMNQFV